MKRSSNAMSVAEYVAVLKQHLPTWQTSFTTTDPEYLLQQYFHLLLAIASESPRLGTSELAKAARQVHPQVSEFECLQFAQAMSSFFKCVAQSVECDFWQAPECRDECVACSDALA